MENKKQSVVQSLDGSNIGIFPYLAYILQDIWEIGADPRVMSDLIKKNIDIKQLKILDLGCGKGAVAVNIARELDCTVKGIDLMPEFIKTAKKYARKHRVAEKCVFETGDIRTRIHELKNFDIVILGAIGPILGQLHTTLKKVAGSLKKQGYVLLDDSYINDNSKTDYNRCLRKSEFYKQINSAGFEIIKEVIFDISKIENCNKFTYELIEKRINELINQLPEKREIFLNYLKCQEYEIHIIENELVSGTWLLKLKK